MLIIYASKTGNVKRFIEKTGLPALRITEDLSVVEPFVLVTYTTGFGKVPTEVSEFLKRPGHAQLLRGVAASGNRNWGGFFAISAKLIADAYSVPVVAKIEMAGKPSEVEHFIQEVRKLEAY